MLLPNLSFTPAVPGLRAVPTGDAGDAFNRLRIRDTLNTVKVMHAEQKFPDGPPGANGEAGEWKTTRVKTTGCCGIDGAKSMTVWVFDKDPKTGVAFETGKEVELFTGICSVRGVFIGLFFLVALGVIGTGVGIAVWQSNEWGDRMAN